METRGFKYYDLVMVAFVTVLLCSNLIGVSKVAQIGGFTFGAGVIFFPISYVFGDILTEVYGYARARKVVWAGFGAMIFASLMSAFVVAMDPAEGWPNQAAIETVFGQVPRIVIASLIAFFCGEFSNSFVLARMKILTEGKKLWMRTIGSTMVGEAVDSVIFYPLAFLAIGAPGGIFNGPGAWPSDLVLKVMVGNYLIKVGVEVLMTPITYKVVAFLKRTEGVDHYDRDTNFTPFSLKT